MELKVIKYIITKRTIKRKIQLATYVPNNTDTMKNKN